MKKNNEEKNMINIVIFNICFWFINIFFLEIAFRILMNYNINIESLVNIFLHTIIFSSLLSIITMSFKNKIITSIILLVIGILFSVQYVFYNTFKTYFSFSNLALADQVGGFFGDAIGKIFDSIFAIVLFLIPFFIYILLKKKIKLSKQTLKENIFCILISIITIVLFHINLYITNNKQNSSYELYYNENNIALNNEKFGVLKSYELDISKYIFGFEQKIEEEEVIEASVDIAQPKTYEYNILELDFEKETSNRNIKEINEYIKNDNATQQNEYTGMFKDYNLIYITAESFYEIAIDKELTPTLYKMTHSGFIFENYYTPNVLSTIGGEFQSLTGLYPNSEILSKWRTGENFFPFGLGTIFQELGYSTYAYHNHTYTFQDRNKYLKSQGFTNYLAVKNRIRKENKCKNMARE